jgi:hypothetical protein
MRRARMRAAKRELIKAGEVPYHVHNPETGVFTYTSPNTGLRSTYVEPDMASFMEKRKNGLLAEKEKRRKKRAEAKQKEYEKRDKARQRQRDR